MRISPLLGLLALLAPLAGSLRADLVTVVNGDTLNGRVDKIENGKLYLRTEYAGTVAIDWEKVTDIEMAGAFQVLTESGRQYLGEMIREGERVSVWDEDVEMAFQARQVRSAIRVVDNQPPGFWKTLKGTVGVGYSFTRGNSEQTQSSVTAEGSYRQPKYKMQADLSSILSRQEEAEQQARHALNGRYDRFLNERAFAFGLTAFERNDRQKLDLRSRFGGGFGWKVANSNDNEFDLLGGATLTNEQFRAPEDNGLLPKDTSGEGLFGFEWETSKLFGVRLTTRLTAHPNLVQQGRYRIEYDSTARIPLILGLTWNLSVFDRFDSDPPREDVMRNDYGMVSAFGFSF